MDWAKKHLNWTYAIILLVSILILILSIIITRSFGPVFAIGLGVFYLLNIAGGAWVLRQKGQTLWIVLLAIFFFLAFVLLVFLLPDKKTGRGEGRTISEAEYYKEREADVK